MKHQHVMIGIFLAIIVLSLTYNHNITEGFNELTESACESHCEDKCSGGDSPAQPPTPTGGGGGAGKCSGSPYYCPLITNEAQCSASSGCTWGGGSSGGGSSGAGGAGKCSGSPYYCPLITNEAQCSASSGCTWGGGSSGGGDNPKPSTSTSYNCNSSNGSCIQVTGTSGTYQDLNTCHASCKKNKPPPPPKDSSGYNCIQNRCSKVSSNATFKTASECASSCGKSGGGKGGNSKLPAEIIGYYCFTWGPGSTGPSGANIGVTFSGWMPGESQGDVPPKTKNKDNFISYGGGDDKGNGAWSPTAIKKLTDSSQIQKIKGLGYSGVCFDVEQGSGTVQNFTDAFIAVKNAGLTVMVTTSWYAPYGFSNAAALASDWLNNPNIDILSPQLYHYGTETSINWGSIDERYKNCKAKLAPSIVDASMYADVKSKLPNAVGFFQWKQV